MKTRVLRVSDPKFREWLRSLPMAPVVAILLGGDRLSCCDEAVVGEVGGQIVGASTIAPKGEMGSGKPTILAAYVVPELRGRGYGSIIFRAAVERCLQRGFSEISADVLSTGGRRVIEKLSGELREHLIVNDQGALLDSLPG